MKFMSFAALAGKSGKGNWSQLSTDSMKQKVGEFYKTGLKRSGILIMGFSRSIPGLFKA
jgi:hypothetical protein